MLDLVNFTVYYLMLLSTIYPMKPNLFIIDKDRGKKKKEKKR